MRLIYYIGNYVNIQTQNKGNFDQLIHKMRESNPQYVTPAVNAGTQNDDYGENFTNKDRSLPTTQETKQDGSLSTTQETKHTHCQLDCECAGSQPFKIDQGRIQPEHAQPINNDNQFTQENPVQGAIYSQLDVAVPSIPNPQIGSQAGGLQSAKSKKGPGVKKKIVKKCDFKCHNRPKKLPEEEKYRKCQEKATNWKKIIKVALVHLKVKDPAKIMKSFLPTKLGRNIGAIEERLSLVKQLKDGASQAWRIPIIKALKAIIYDQSKTILESILKAKKRKPNSNLSAEKEKQRQEELDKCIIRSYCQLKIKLRQYLKDLFPEEHSN